jgi:hypothetical protein
LTISKHKLQRQTIVFCAFAVLVLTLLILNVGSKGPDIANYKIFTLDTGGFAHKAFALLLLYTSVYLPTELLLTVFAPVVLFIFDMRRFSEVLLSSLALLIIFHFSYSANSLLGNIIRQGFATILFIISVRSFEKFSITWLPSVAFHQALFPVFFVIKLIYQKKLKSIFSIKNIVISGCLLASFIIVFAERISILFERIDTSDLPGFIFVYFLLFLRFFLFDIINHKNLINWLILISFLVLGLIFGEFAQRVIISIIFCLDIYYARKNFNKQRFYQIYIPILAIEAYFRYQVVGNFWGVITNVAYT